MWARHADPNTYKCPGEVRSSAEFSGGTVNFGGSRFAGGTVDFDHARFACGWISFNYASFSGGMVSFSSAVFSGGTLDFARARQWSHPPMFSWGGKPPAGVVLPVQPSGETRSHGPPET